MQITSLIGRLLVELAEALELVLLKLLLMLGLMMFLLMLRLMMLWLLLLLLLRVVLGELVVVQFDWQTVSNWLNFSLGEGLNLSLRDGLRVGLRLMGLLNLKIERPRL